MGAEGRVTRRCSLLSRHIQDLQADGLFCICLEVYTTSGAFPAFVVLPAVAGHAVLFGVLHQGAAVFHILCYVILSMRLEAPFGWFVQLYYTTWSPPVSFFGFHCSIWIVALHARLSASQKVLTEKPAMNILKMRTPCIVTPGNWTPAVSNRLRASDAGLTGIFFWGGFAQPFTANGKPAVPSNRKAWRVFI